MPPPDQHETNAGHLHFFTCGSCGKRLSVNRHSRSLTGPCPACGVVVHATVSSPDIHHEKTAHPLATVAVRPEIIRSRKEATRRGKGHIPADSMLDHRHISQREATKTLLILMLFVLAVCACLAVSWFLNHLTTR